MGALRVAATLAVLTTSSAFPVLRAVETVGPAESVYDWETEHCADGVEKGPLGKPYRRDVPDAPAMAWRDPVSNLTFVAPGDSRGTWPSVGIGLDNVRHTCNMMIFNYSGPRGWRDLGPQYYSSHEWLYAPFVVPPTRGDGSGNATVYMLVHNEFHGWEHIDQGLCNATSMVQSRCWYNSVTLSVSHDGGRTFVHAAEPPSNLIATADDVYVANQSMYGSFSPSQIVSADDGYLYSFPIYVSRSNAGVRGVASMRTKDISDPKSWRFSTDLDLGPAGYTGKFTDPYTGKMSAEPDLLKFGNGSRGFQLDSTDPHFSQPVPRWVPSKRMFIMIGYENAGVGNTHFAVSTAALPWGPWTDMVAVPADINPKNDTPAIRGIYPSLLDPSSPSLNYDTIVNTDQLYVYWVQGRNKAVVGAPDMARDLVRQPIRLVF